MAVGTEALPWILISVALVVVIAILAVILWFFGREVRRIRQEVFRVKESPTAAPLPPPAPGAYFDGGVGRVELEAPPCDWPTGADDRPLSQHQEVHGPLPPVNATVVMMHPLRLKIVGTEGPVERPVYCVCQIRGKPLSKITTRVVNVIDGAADPTWNHEASIVDFCQGDALLFAVYDQDWGRADELLGEVLLTCDRFLERDLFEEALPLTQAGRASGPSGPWECPRCTMQNPASNTICSVCEGPRPPQAAQAATSRLSLRVEITSAVFDPHSTPFFTARWTSLDSSSRAPAMGEFAMRNDWDGEVGFRFRTRTPVVISALGRQVLGGVLRDTVVVTLWSDETQAELATVNVGPASIFEGGYAFSSLPQPLLLEADKELRITQQCFPGMADLWFDGCAEPAQLSRESAARYLEFLGSVYHGGRAFPGLIDRERCEYRRASMLNLKLLGRDPADEAERYRQTGSVALQRAGPQNNTVDATEDQMQIRLICMSPAPKEQAN